MAKHNDKLAAVRLDVPGVAACGPYKAGQVYPVGADLTQEEAERLVKVKGFTALSAADLKGEEKTAEPAEAAESTGQPADKAED